MKTKHTGMRFWRPLTLVAGLLLAIASGLLLAQPGGPRSVSAQAALVFSPAPPFPPCEVTPPAPDPTATVDCLAPIPGLEPPDANGALGPPAVVVAPLTPIDLAVSRAVTYQATIVPREIAGYGLAMLFADGTTITCGKSFYFVEVSPGEQVVVEQVGMTVGQPPATPIFFGTSGLSLSVGLGTPHRIEWTLHKDSPSPTDYSATCTYTNLATGQSQTVTATTSAVASQTLTGVGLFVINSGSTRDVGGRADATFSEFALGGLTFNVNSTVDAVDAVPGNVICATAFAVCTLRAAIQEANALAVPSITINVPAGTYTLTIAGNGEDSSATGDLDITRALFIQGAGAASTIVTQSTSDRVFDILDTFSEINVGMAGITITGGAPPAGQGGAGIQNLANLTLVDSTIRDNTAIAGGGGIFQHLATAVIFSTTISTNATGTLGGGIENSSSALIIVNSTMSGNTAGLSGGALSQVGVTSDVSLVNATITGNIASSSGGGIELNAGTSTVRNTIIAGNTSGFGPNCTGTWTSAGYSLVGHDTGCTFLATTGDQVGTLAIPVDPLLGPLTDNGGPTLTHAIHGVSPATDAGNPAAPGSGGDACEPVDQRGEARPKDGDLDTAAICDIGAFEALGSPTSGGERLLLSFEGDLTVTVPALALNNAPCPVEAVVDAPLGPVVTNGMGKEERAFTIDFLSGWAFCPGPLSLGSSITSGGLIVEQLDTTPGLDFPADMTVTLCLKIDTLEVIGLGELQNCPDGFTLGQKRPIILNCTLFSFTSFTCTIDTGGGAPEFFNAEPTPKSVAVVNSGIIPLVEIPTPTKQPSPADTDGDGCADQQENGLDEKLGGLRDYLNPWDFYDVGNASGYASTTGAKDQVIDLFNDIVLTIQAFSSYNVSADRGPSAGPYPWSMTAPDGNVDLFNDIVGVIQQFGHDCR